jgi:L-threonylcarbamoyladenylate synthase
MKSSAALAEFNDELGTARRLATQRNRFPTRMSSLHLNRAARILRRGGVIAYPTEAVWGLGADPLDESACDHLLAIKQRPWQKGLILVASHEDQLMPFIEVPSKAVWKRAALTWPGPNTWVFPCSDDCPMWISGEQDSVAVRISAHETVRALCERFGGAIVSTSANPATRAPARSATQVRLYFGSDLDYLLPGATGGLDRPTSIRDALTGHILRR